MLDLDQVTVGGTYVDNRTGTVLVVKQIQSHDTDPDKKEVFIAAEDDKNGGVWRSMRHFRSSCRLLAST